MSPCPINKSATENKSPSLLARGIDLTAVMNTVLDGLIIIDKSGIIHAFNPSAVRIFGYTPEEVIGKNVKMLMPDTYAKEHDTYLSNYLSSHKAKVIGIGREVIGKRKNGRVFPMELGVNEMPLDSQLMFVGTVRDISERKNAESEIEAKIQALKRSNQELDDFAYIASHDLKEPLRGLSNNAIFLKEDNRESLSPDALKRVDRLIYLAERMEQLVNDLLYFSRIGNQELAIKETDIKHIIHDISSMMESILTEKNVKIITSDTFPVITCDTLRITEVFRNLITNAVKYNDKQEKIIEIGYLERFPEDKFYTFYVKDNGIGIDKVFYQDVFRIFKRLNDEDDSVKGTGVGLTFVKKIVERHGGKIWLESDLDKGSTFYFTIATDIKEREDGIERNHAYRG